MGQNKELGKRNLFNIKPEQRIKKTAQTIWNERRKMVEVV
jgi:hypothetical protein